MYYKYGEEDYNMLLSKSAYSVKISEILLSEKKLTHKQLYEKLNIQPNHLSNIVRKLEPFNILHVRRIGKQVYYSLTFKGLEFCKFVEETEKPVEYTGTNREIERELVLKKNV